MNTNTAVERLMEERSRLLELRATTEASGTEEGGQQDSLSELSSVDQHPADQGTETLEREQSLSILEQLDAQLVDVDRALKRVDSGDYGKCEACGRPIDEERLKARPAARYCIEDQSRIEREARSAP
jgi:RNA polymerase-binding transcription factor DksA